MQGRLCSRHHASLVTQVITVQRWNFLWRSNIRFHNGSLCFSKSPMSIQCYPERTEPNKCANILCIREILRERVLRRELFPPWGAIYFLQIPQDNRDGYLSVVRQQHDGEAHVTRSPKCWWREALQKRKINITSTTLIQMYLKVSSNAL